MGVHRAVRSALASLLSGLGQLDHGDGKALTPTVASEAQRAVSKLGAALGPAPLVSLLELSLPTTTIVEGEHGPRPAEAARAGAALGALIDALLASDGRNHDDDGKGDGGGGGGNGGGEATGAPGSSSVVAAEGAAEVAAAVRAGAVGAGAPALLLLRERLPPLLRPDAQLQTQLEMTMEVQTDAPQRAQLARAAGLWRRAACEVLRAAAVLLGVVVRAGGGGGAASLLLTNSDGAEGGGDTTAAKAAATGKQGRNRSTQGGVGSAKWSDAAAAEHGAVAHEAEAHAPLAALLLITCDELAGSRGGGKGSEGWGDEDAAHDHDPLESDAVREAADAVVEALGAAAGLPVARLRLRLHGECCRLLHLRLLHAEAAAGSAHRQRRLARALRSVVCAVGRPQLSKAPESHRLLPLLLRWSELLDPVAPSPHSGVPPSPHSGMTPPRQV